MDNPQPPSVIVRNGTIEEFIFPTDNINYISGKDGGWVETPLFPTSSFNREELSSITKKYIGKTIQILLPLQIETVVNEYIFTFQIKNVEVEQAQGNKSTIVPAYLP